MAVAAGASVLGAVPESFTGLAAVREAEQRAVTQHESRKAAVAAGRDAVVQRSLERRPGALYLAILADLVVTAHTEPLHIDGAEYQLVALVAQLAALVATGLVLFWVLAPTKLVARAQYLRLARKFGPTLVALGVHLLLLAARGGAVVALAAEGYPAAVKWHGWCVALRGASRAAQVAYHASLLWASQRSYSQPRLFDGSAAGVDAAATAAAIARGDSVPALDDVADRIVPLAVRS